MIAWLSWSAGHLRLRPAVFVPMHQWLQVIIGRRCYRRKYAAARTLARFSITLRDEVNLADLSERLLAVVYETLQPENVSVWLLTPEREAKP